jgi:hypothetical protein
MTFLTFVVSVISKRKRPGAGDAGSGEGHSMKDLNVLLKVTIGKHG